jgi:hypothetical protein
MLTYEKLIALAEERADQADQIALKEDFDPEADQKAIDDLLAEAESYRKRAEASKKAMTFKVPVPDSTDAPLVTVIADETDKKAAGRTWTMGEFLQGVAHGSREVQPYRSTTNDMVEPGTAPIRTTQ